MDRYRRPRTRMELVLENDALGSDRWHVESRKLQIAA